MDFRNYVRSKIKPTDKIIEFGPLNRPLFKKNEFKNIYYADIRSTEEVKDLYSGNDYLLKTGIKIDVDSIVEVDYKINTTYKNTFKDKKFNVAYLSHVIEHIPDLINFFYEIDDVLENNAMLVLIYPDKRYCFDHFRNEASFRDAFATHKFGLKENARMAFDFSYNVVAENDPTRFWNDKNITDIISNVSIDDGESYYEKVVSGESLEDVHFWPFSDYGFLKFIYEMQRAKMLNFDVKEFFPTQENTQEFLIILQKTKKVDISKTISLLKKYDTFYEEREKLKKYDVVTGEVKKLKEDLYQLGYDNSNLKKRIAELEVELDAVYNSTSMKITQPLRTFRSLFRKK